MSLYTLINVPPRLHVLVYWLLPPLWPVRAGTPQPAALSRRVRDPFFPPFIAFRTASCAPPPNLPQQLARGADFEKLEVRGVMG